MGDRERVLDARVEGRVGIIELSRPDKFNCLSGAVALALDDALEAFTADDTVRAVLVCAQGKHFCTGADLDEVLDVRRDKDRLRAFIEVGQGVLSRLDSISLPTVAAVQGLCLAGGLELMLACDVAFAAEGAEFGDQHAAYGLVPGWGGSQRLPRAIGMRRALDLFYSHRWISAQQAFDWGMVNYVVPDDQLRAEALSYCSTLADKGRNGLATMKRLAREGMEMSLDDGIRLECDLVVEHLAGPETTEGLAAFQERRPPRFD